MLRRRGGGGLVRRLLGEELYESVAGYAAKRGLGIEEALCELVRKGLRYAELESLYGRNVAAREVWDRRFYFMKVEACYLRYKLRLREVVEDMRRVLMVMSSLVSELGSLGGDVEGLRSLVKHYMDKYLFSNRDALQVEEDVSDEEVLRSIKEAVARYEEALHSETRRGGPRSHSGGT